MWQGAWTVSGCLCVILLFMIQFAQVTLGIVLATFMVFQQVAVDGYKNKKNDSKLLKSLGCLSLIP